ncbi:MAG: hypothetical protein GX921_00175 [Bacteroidales bacterium]|nr:hypothetical protein [Bacteroidales bacterium]
MRNRTILIFSVLVLLIFVSCDKENSRIPDFLVEFATVVKKESSITIQLDNGNVLTPEPPSNKLDIEDSSRVIINYTPLENNFIKINNIQKIFLGNIEEELPEHLASDPIKIISIWVSGSYLNISLQADYHSEPHSISLFRDMQTEKPTLYLSYSRKDDPAGAPTLMHSSFNLENLQNESFIVYIDTYNGRRKFDL